MIRRHHGWQGFEGGDEFAIDAAGGEFCFSSGEDAAAMDYAFRPADFEAAGGELMYFDQRAFDPRPGQFLAPDPIEVDAANNYRYVGGGRKSFLNSCENVESRGTKLETERGRSQQSAQP